MSNNNNQKRKNNLDLDDLVQDQIQKKVKIEKKQQNN